MKTEKRLAIEVLLIVFVIGFLLVSASAAVLLSDQGTDVKDKTTGQLLESGNLTITIYDAAADGTLIFNLTTTNAIANGSWNLMISANLEFGNTYWKDYMINGEDLDFDGNERISFQSPLGQINNASLINFSLINNCSAGSSIRMIYANGSVVCETDDSGSGNVVNGTTLTITNITDFLYNYNTTSLFTTWLATFYYNYNQTGAANNYNYNETLAANISIVTNYGIILGTTINRIHFISIINQEFIIIIKREQQAIITTTRH